MEPALINLELEQEATLRRPRCKYSLQARLFFRAMDVVAGSKTSLAKLKALELLASIPYREWEIRQYAWLSRVNLSRQAVEKAGKIMVWARRAQDNEYWHLLVISEKMKAEGLKDPWYLRSGFPAIMVWSYVAFSRIAARIDIRRAFLFNAEFEDHAEHVYAEMVKDNPEWEREPVPDHLVEAPGHVKTWADLFRRIGLDERDHMNHSLIFAGKPQAIVKYEGMPSLV